MLRLCHITICGHRVAEAELRRGKRPKLSALHRRHGIAQKVTEGFCIVNRGSPEVDDMVLDIPAELRHLLSGPDVSLTDLEEAAAGRERGATLRHEISRQR